MLDAVTTELKRLTKVKVIMPFVREKSQYQNINKKFNLVASLPDLESLVWETNDSWRLQTDTIEDMLTGLTKFPKNLNHLALVFITVNSEDRPLNYDSCIASIKQLQKCNITSLKLSFQHYYGRPVRWPENFLDSVIGLIHLKELALNFFDFCGQDINPSLSVIVERLHCWGLGGTIGLASFFSNTDFGPYLNLKCLRFEDSTDLTQDNLVSFVSKKCPNLVEIYLERSSGGYVKDLISKLQNRLHPCANGYIRTFNPCNQPLKINYFALIRFCGSCPPIPQTTYFRLDLCGISVSDHRPVISRTCMKTKL